MTELRCKSCSRYLGDFECVVGEIMCPNSSCKAGNQVKILNNDLSHLLSFKFASAPKPPKEKPTPESQTQI